MKRKQYEEKFDVDVTDDPSSGKTSVQDREKDEVSNDMNWISSTLSLWLIPWNSLIIMKINLSFLGRIRIGKN